MYDHLFIYKQYLCLLGQQPPKKKKKKNKEQSNGNGIDVSMKSEQDPIITEG